MSTKKFTKKSLKAIKFQFSWSRAIKARMNTFYSVGYKSGWANMRNLYKFFLLNRRFIKILYFGVLRDKPAGLLHKNHFKKSKKRLYSQSFFFTLERRLCSVLYKVGLVSSIGYLKKLVFHNLVFMNGFSQFGYSSLLSPLDFVYTRIPVLTNSLGFTNFVVKRDKELNAFPPHIISAIISIFRVLRGWGKFTSALFINKIRRRYLFYKKLNMTDVLSVIWAWFDFFHSVWVLSLISSVNVKFLFLFVGGTYINQIKFSLFNLLLIESLLSQCLYLKMGGLSQHLISKKDSLCFNSIFLLSDNFKYSHNITFYKVLLYIWFELSGLL